MYITHKRVSVKRGVGAGAGAGVEVYPFFKRMLF